MKCIHKRLRVTKITCEKVFFFFNVFWQLFIDGYFVWIRLKITPNSLRLIFLNPLFVLHYHIFDWPRACILAHLSWKRTWAFLIACCSSAVYYLLHFHLLLQEHIVNFNNSLGKKATFGQGDSSYSKSKYC